MLQGGWLLTSKQITQILVGFFIVALAVPAIRIWLLPNPGSSAHFLGTNIGGAIAGIVIPGVIPLIVWAFWRFRAEDAWAVIFLWGFFGLAMNAAIVGGALMGADAQRSKMEQPFQSLGEQRDEFVRGMVRVCIDHQRNSGFTEQIIKTYCYCSSYELAKAVSTDELKIYISTMTAPPSLKEKADRAAKTCGAKIGK